MKEMFLRVALSLEPNCLRSVWSRRLRVNRIRIPLELTACGLQ